MFLAADAGNAAAAKLDINEGMLTAARRNPQIAWHQGSATELPFAKGTLTLVFLENWALVSPVVFAHYHA